MARSTGLEPATSGVTGRHSNQLSYDRAILCNTEACKYGSCHFPSSRKFRFYSDVRGSLMPRRSAVGLPCGGNVNLTVAPCSRKQVPAIRGTTTACGFRPVWRVPVSVFSTSHAKGAGRVPQLRIFLNTTEHFEELSRHLPNHGAASCKTPQLPCRLRFRSRKARQFGD